MSANQCFHDVSPDGKCLATEVDTVQEITELDMVAGDWWVVAGVNCGQDSVWVGGYDWYPCQHQRYVKLGELKSKDFDNVVKVYAKYRIGLILLNLS